jgi:Sulfotransferase family
MSGHSATPELAVPRPERARAPDGRPHVIYVMGAGRSGSTVLGIALGNCANVFYAGELDNWLVRSGAPQVESPERTRFWSSVRGELEDLGAASELFGNEAQRSIERSLSLLRVHRWPARYKLRRRYRAVAEDLYRALTRTAGVTHVADTSHYPLRAYELQRIGGIELYLVFLVRDPQSVVASFNRRDVREHTKSTLHTNLYLWLTHALSLCVFLMQPRERRLFVRHEDFVADPKGVVRQILDRSGASSVALPDFTALDTGFPLQGNRVTRSQTLSLKPTTDPPPRSSRVTAVLQAPLTAAFSRLRPRAAIGRGA